MYAYSATFPLTDDTFLQAYCYSKCFNKLINKNVHGNLKCQKWHRLDGSAASAVEFSEGLHVKDN